MYLFWITIVFSIVYLVIYPGFGNVNEGRGQVSQYQAEMQAADEKYGPTLPSTATWNWRRLR